MSTPNTNSTPYSKPLQYPSQTPDYISLESGGPHRQNFKMQQPYRGRESPYQHHPNQRKHHFNKHFDFRENRRKQFNQNRQSTEYDFSSYFHPSMLQDPWKNLMKRYDSLCASEISHPETPSAST